MIVQLVMFADTIRTHLHAPHLHPVLLPADDPPPVGILEEEGQFFRKKILKGVAARLQFASRFPQKIEIWKSERGRQ